MHRKGFPESYDLERMLVFLAELREGKSELRVPVYSHELYDIVPGQFQTINQPQVLILEGLNVLQGSSRDSAAVAADYFDFSVYLDADQNDVEQWYVERFSVLQRTVFQRPTSYFHHFKDLRPAEVQKDGAGNMAVNQSAESSPEHSAYARARVRDIAQRSIARSEGSAVATVVVRAARSRRCVADLESRRFA